MFWNGKPTRFVESTCWWIFLLFWPLVKIANYRTLSVDIKIQFNQKMHKFQDSNMKKKKY